MIKIKKENEDIYYEQGENFWIYTRQYYYTTKNKQSALLWYYEGTAYSGNGLSPIGYSINKKNSYVAFFRSLIMINH